MGFSAGIAEAGQTYKANRNGNRYNPSTGARESALNPEGAPVPELEVFAISYADLVKLDERYPGFNRIHMQDGTPVDPWMDKKKYDGGAIDHWKMQSDGSTCFRADQWGNVNTALRDLKPDHSGVISTEEVGPGGQPSTPTGGVAQTGETLFLDKDAPHHPMTFPRIGGSSKGVASLVPGVTGRADFAIPEEARGKGWALTVAEYPVGQAVGLTVRYMVNGEEVRPAATGAKTGGGVAQDGGVIGDDDLPVGPVSVLVTTENAVGLLLNLTVG